MYTQKTTNIFIVDDNGIFSLTLKSSIEGAFEDRLIKIHLFETGEKCLEKLAELKPQLIILDYFLDSKSADAVDGIQVLEKIKAYDANTSVIMLTSNDFIEIALKSFHRGAFDYVIKSKGPFAKINESISKYFSNNDLLVKTSREVKRLSDEELDLTAKEKEIWANQLLSINNELTFQNEEKAKGDAELELIKAVKLEMEKSKMEVDEKNKSITDSINYAKLIQEAKLPKREDIKEAFPDSFVFFKPKDIVSGDFYYLKKGIDNVFIAAADCTGHGVPGAFMSMIGSEKLSSAISLTENTSEILMLLNKGIKKTLRQTENDDSTKDGMDIALCSVDTKSRVVKYAGANRPIWIIRKHLNCIEETKPTKKAIGGFTDDNQFFETHEINLNAGDTFYIFTDGFADAFGGEHGKKLMSRRFREVLLEIQDKSMIEQGEYLQNYMSNWTQSLEQVDDVLVIGIRL
ncbi:MAG: response regulator [Bacteroidetes bacterium]|nr:response regulator [Bacteroidota bacterium]